MAARREIVEDVGRLRGLVARLRTTSAPPDIVRDLSRLAASIHRSLEPAPAVTTVRDPAEQLAMTLRGRERKRARLERDLAASLRQAMSLQAALRKVSAPVAEGPAPQPLVLRLRSDAVVEDCPQRCLMTAIGCTARQIQSDLERDGKATRFAKDPKRRRDRADRPPELARHDHKRGTQASRPTCVTSLCAVGAVVRALHGDTPEAIEMARRAPRASDTAEG